MNEIMNNYLQQIVLLLILALAGWLGAQAKNLYKKYITTEIKQNVCRTVVRFVEQVYQDLHGPEKLAQAMAKASEILEGYGITISESELVAMIEAAVNEFNNAFGWTESGKHLSDTKIMSTAQGRFRSTAVLRQRGSMASSRGASRCMLGM